MILGESGIGFGQTLDIVARGRILICFFNYFLLLFIKVLYAKLQGLHFVASEECWF